MTITHETTPDQPVQEEPKRKGKRVKDTTPVDIPATEQPASEPTATQPMTTEPSQQPAKRGKPKKAPKGPAPLMTLAELGEHYVAHLEATKSAGTALSYKMEIDRAVAFLGADTPIHTITREDVARFNASDIVMRKKNGSPKAAPSYLKTQRVLRLALTWAAHDRKWIEWVPFAQSEAESK